VVWWFWVKAKRAFLKFLLTGRQVTRRGTAHPVGEGKIKCPPFGCLNRLGEVWHMIGRSMTSPGRGNNVEKDPIKQER